ncbi:hypothetical protein HUJ04_002063 [Dendroctonus ponderosae]|nr:hypothetical protein HUJ04_002063 [Dendroctonus ponderosae]
MLKDPNTSWYPDKLLCHKVCNGFKAVELLKHQQFSFWHIYLLQVALAANDTQAKRDFNELKHIPKLFNAFMQEFNKRIASECTYGSSFPWRRLYKVDRFS